MTQNELIAWGLNPKFITPQFLESIGCTATLPNRFVKQVTKSDGCWLWPWGQGGSKYATLGKGKAGAGCIGAHVTSWILHFGPMQTGTEICHTCDNPRCVRPDHLFQGTHSDNMRDAWKKGRGKNLCFGGKRKGQDSPASVLTDGQVLRIVERYNKTLMTQTEVAKEFGVTQTCVGHIVTGRTWSHITGIKH